MDYQYLHDYQDLKQYLYANSYENNFILPLSLFAFGGLLTASFLGVKRMYQYMLTPNVVEEIPEELEEIPEESELDESLEDDTLLNTLIEDLDNQFVRRITSACIHRNLRRNNLKLGKTNEDILISTLIDEWSYTRLSTFINCVDNLNLRSYINESPLTNDSFSSNLSFSSSSSSTSAVSTPDTSFVYPDPDTPLLNSQLSNSQLPEFNSNFNFAEYLNN
jgi:hypothetical protein